MIRSLFRRKTSRGRCLLGAENAASALLLGGPGSSMAVAQMEEATAAPTHDGFARNTTGT